MQSVLHVALIAPSGYTNEPIMNAFINNDFNAVHTFDYQLEMFTHGKEIMREHLLQLARQAKPDLIFLHVQNSEVLDLDTVKELSSIGFTVLYTFDVRDKERTEWMYSLVPYLGLVCFSNQEDVNECLVRWNNNVMVLQSSCDMNLYCPPKEPCVKKGIVFIGGVYTNTNLNFPLADDRERMVRYLELMYPKDFTALGMGRPGSGLVRLHEEINIYYGSKIAISQNNYLRELYTSDRLWRIMATGTFCLTQYFQGIETMFQRGVHLDWWNDFDELSEKIDYYLSHDDERSAIAEAGMNLVRERHTWTDRIKEMLEKAESFLPKEIPCKDAHRVKGELPLEDRHAGICDCGKMKFEWIECGCANKGYQIRATQNI